MRWVELVYREGVQVGMADREHIYTSHFPRHKRIAIEVDPALATTRSPYLCVYHGHLSARSEFPGRP